MAVGCTAAIEKHVGASWFLDCWHVERNGRRQLFYSIYRSILNVVGWQTELQRFCITGERYLCGTLNDCDVSCQALERLCSSRSSTISSPLFIYVYSQLFAVIRDNLEVRDALAKDKETELFSTHAISTPKQRAILLHAWKLVQRFEQFYLDAKRYSQESFMTASQPHESMLMRLWTNLQPEKSLSGRIDDDWKSIGFQGRNPETDFRGMGMLGLHQLVQFSNTCDGKSLFCAFSAGGSEYFPFAIAGINITNSIMTMPKKQLFVQFLRYCRALTTAVEGEKFAFVDWLYGQIFHKLFDNWNCSDRNISNFNAILAKAVHNF